MVKQFSKSLPLNTQNCPIRVWFVHVVLVTHTHLLLWTLSLCFFLVTFHLFVFVTHASPSTRKRLTMLWALIPYTYRMLRLLAEFQHPARKDKLTLRHWVVSGKEKERKIYTMPEICPMLHVLTFIACDYAFSTPDELFLVLLGLPCF